MHADRPTMMCWDVYDVNICASYSAPIVSTESELFNISYTSALTMVLQSRGHPRP
jgi:hypothetical protein